MAILSDIMDEWGKLNGPGKLAVGGALIGVAFIAISVHRSNAGGGTGATQGNVLGNSAATSPFSITTTTPPSGSTVPPVAPPVIPPVITKIISHFPPFAPPIHYTPPPRPVPIGTYHGRSPQPANLHLLANNLSAAVHPIERITHDNVGARQWKVIAS